VASIFVSYAHEDEGLCKSLVKHLSGIRHRGLAEIFYDRDLPAGSELEPEIEAQLRRADVILLLVSPDFIQSTSCSREVSVAMERHAARDAIVVPVILRDCDWSLEPYQQLLALPEDGRSIESFRRRNTALKEVAIQIKQIVFGVLRRETEAETQNVPPPPPPENKTMEIAVKEVVGFDLGHGESAVARISLRPSATPQILEIHGKRSQISAIGILDGAPIVGELVVQSPRVTAPRMGFKLRPPGTDESRAALTAFVREYDSILTSTGQILGGAETHYFVGRPSVWTSAESEHYRRLLQTVLRRVTVVPESRAALIEAKEKYALAPEQVREAILIIDFGSSTIDVSLVFRGIQDESLDTGTELGAHLIEKEMLRRAIERSPQREEVLAFFSREGGENHRRVCEARCRELKESYWNLEAISRSEPRESLIKVAAGLMLETRIDREEMESILSAPLAELGDESWKTKLNHFLDEVRTTLDQRGRLPQVVVLTGGASAMSFIRELCKERFPEAERHVWCTPTEETVALGLARWGSIQLQASAFGEEVREFCEVAVPQIVQQHMDALRTAIASELAEHLSKEVVIPALRDWRRHSLKTLAEMKTKLAERTVAWLRSEQGVETIWKACRPVLAQISDEVNRGTFPICIRHDIPASSMEVNLNVALDRGIDFRVETPFEAALGIAGGISMVAVFVLGVIAKGVLASVSFAAGPPGWLVAAIIAAWTSLFGVMKLEEIIEDFNAPLFLRQLFLSDEKLQRVAKAAIPRIGESLQNEIDDAAMQRIRTAISAQVTEFLNARANDVKWIIADSGEV
jgi:hypothetical protein